MGDATPAATTATAEGEDQRLPLVFALHVDGGSTLHEDGELIDLPVYAGRLSVLAALAAEDLKRACPEALVTLVVWPDDDPMTTVVRDAVGAVAALGTLRRAARVLRP